MSKKLLLGALLVSSTMALATNTSEPSSAPWDLKDRWDSASLRTKVGILGSSSAFIFMAMSLYHLMLNDPKTDFKEKGEWKKLANAKLLAHQPKKYLQNVSDVYWYRWIGQYFKDNKVKLNSAGDVKMSKKKYPHGFMGNAYTHLYAAKKTAGLVGDIAAVLPPIFGFCFAAEKLGLFGFGKSKDESKDESKDAPVSQQKEQTTPVSQVVQQPADNTALNNNLIALNSNLKTQAELKSEINKLRSDLRKLRKDDKDKIGTFG